MMKRTMITRKISIWNKEERPMTYLFIGMMIGIIIGALLGASCATAYHQSKLIKEMKRE